MGIPAEGENTASFFEPVDYTPLAPLRRLLQAPTTTFCDGVGNLVSLPQEDWDLTLHRPSDRPIDGKCPVEGCGHEFIDNPNVNAYQNLSARMTHIRRCRLQEAQGLFNFAGRVPSHPQAFVDDPRNPFGGRPIFGISRTVTTPIPGNLTSPLWLLSIKVRSTFDNGRGAYRVCSWCPPADPVAGVAANAGDTVRSFAQARWHLLIRHDVFLPPVATRPGSKKQAGDVNTEADAKEAALRPWTAPDSKFFETFPPLFSTAGGAVIVDPWEQHERAVNILQEMKDKAGLFGLRSDVGWEKEDTDALQPAYGAESDRRYAAVHGRHGARHIVKHAICVLCTTEDWLPLVVSLAAHIDPAYTTPSWEHLSDCGRTTLREVQAAIDADKEHYLVTPEGARRCTAWAVA